MFDPFTIFVSLYEEFQEHLGFDKHDSFVSINIYEFFFLSVFFDVTWSSGLTEVWGACCFYSQGDHRVVSGSKADPTYPVTPWSQSRMIQMGSGMDFLGRFCPHRHSHEINPMDHSGAMYLYHTCISLQLMTNFDHGTWSIGFDTVDTTETNPLSPCWLLLSSQTFI